MIEILKKEKGALQSEKYKHKCSECGCIFTYQKDDCWTWGINILLIQCPCCHSSDGADFKIYKKNT